MLIVCIALPTVEVYCNLKAIWFIFEQDSLAKFAGRKLKDCGEDLLVEISEVLFNELAFFKLMQDLDNNSITVKQRCKRKIEAAGVIQSYAKEVNYMHFDFRSSYN